MPNVKQAISFRGVGAGGVILKLLGVSLADLVAQDDRSIHLIQVLKLQPQDQVKVGIVNGPLGQATVLHTHPNIVLECHLWQPTPILGQLYLVLAMPRPKVMKRLWSTLACLGVTRVYITGAEKVEKVYFASHALKPERFYPELIHGAEQAGDTRLPAVFFSKSLHATLAAVQSAVDITSPSQQSPKPMSTPRLDARMPGQMPSPSEQALARNLSKPPQALQAGTSRGVQCLLSQGASSVFLPAVQHQNQASWPASVTPQMPPAAPHTPDSNVTDVSLKAIKLLAHTLGDLSVHQAVASHMAVHGNSSLQAAKGVSLGAATSAALADQSGSDSQQPYDRLVTADDKLTAAGTEVRVGGQWQDDLIGKSITDTERQTSATDRPINGPETQERPVIVLAIGPEGGWVDSEIALLTKQYGFRVVTTAGNRILDTTTAVISLLSLAVDAVSMETSIDR
ncbi:hypothetical protein WJX77_004049 [Trebouxia sp. C0004]